MKFVLIGIEEHVRGALTIPENMTVVGLTPRKELLKYYRGAKIYCQPSIHEAVGYSLREAMLCGCIPVVTDVGGMPTAAAGIGLLVPPGDVEALVSALQQASMHAGDAGTRGRARMVALYPPEARRVRLLHAVREIAA